MGMSIQAVGIIGLHERGLVHTDLRPECILVDEEGHVLISDFSKARFLRGDSATYRAESNACLPEDQMFHAPELVLGWDHDYVVDWWSFGLLLFWIFTRTVCDTARHSTFLDVLIWTLVASICYRR